MVKIQVLALENLPAILTGLLVALEDIVARQLQLLAGQPVEMRQQDHAGEAYGDARRMHLVHDFKRGIFLREIHPVHHVKNAKVVLVVVNDARVTSRQQTKGAFGADNIYRLPQAIENQNRLV